MARGSRAARTNPQGPGLQQALRQLVEGAEADAAFLATSSAWSVGKSFSLVAWYPPAGQRALRKSRWIHRAVNRTLESGRTALTVGAWRPPADHPRRPELLIVASVFNKASPMRGALALLSPSPAADLEVVARLERSAREMASALIRSGRVSEPSPAMAPPLSELSERRNHILLHELRVPLGAASVALETLAMRHATQWEGEDERLIRTAQFGLLEAQGVLRLVDPAHAAGGALAPPSLSDVSLVATLERARELFPEARGRLRLDLYDNLPPVRADALWLTQALTNLLENALRYSWPRTLITVAARPHAPDRVLISVQSFGEEFPADQRQIVERDALNALPTSPTSRGLGLSIARYLIAGMGGEIWVDRGELGATEIKLALPIAFA